MQQVAKPGEDQRPSLNILLVVILIIGVLSAIALPSFLSQAAKARQSEAKSFVGSYNRAQQAYRVENTSFASTDDQLQLGLPTETENYVYTIAGDDTDATINAAAKDGEALRSYAGGVVLRASGQTQSVTCQTLTVSATPPTLALLPTAEPACATGEPMK